MRARSFNTCVRFVVVVATVLCFKTLMHFWSLSSQKSTNGAVQVSLSSVAEPMEDVSVLHLPERKSGGQNHKVEVVVISNDTYENVVRTFKHTGQSEYEDMPRIVKELITATSTCPYVTPAKSVKYSPSGEYWQMNRQGLEEIHIFSAFYDDRPPVGILPFLRLMAVSTLPKNATIYCQVWYKGLRNSYVTPAIIHTSGRGDRVYGIKYGQWLYSCKLPSSLPIPSHVSVSFEKCQNTSMLVPVYLPVRSPWQHEFGVCVAIAFGKVDVDIVVEWVEMNRFFGVTEINVYNASMSEDMNKVFDYYKRIGVMRIHQMPPPQPDYSKKGSKLSSPASLNDCMLRNAYRYRYMIVIDFDEVIIPKSLSNYSQMLIDIDKKNKLSQPWMSYSFRNDFYFYEYEADKSQPEYLRMMRYREHAKPSRYLFAPKSFVDPLQCLSLFNHYCYIRFPGSPKKFTIDVDTSIATSHHYKKCGFGSKTCKEYEKEKTKEEYILAMASLMRGAVSKVLKEIEVSKGDDKTVMKKETNSKKTRSKRDTRSKDDASKKKVSKKKEKSTKDKTPNKVSGVDKSLNQSSVVQNEN